MLVALEGFAVTDDDIGFDDPADDWLPPDDWLPREPAHNPPAACQGQRPLAVRKRKEIQEALPDVKPART